MNINLLEDGLNALKTRGFAGDREGDIRLISLRNLTREQLERVMALVEAVGDRVGVPAEVTGIGYGCTTVVVRIKTSDEPEKSQEQIHLIFAGISRLTAVRDCDIQIMIESARGRRVDLRQLPAEKEDGDMDLVAVGGALSSAVAIIKNLPGAIEAARKSGLDFDNAAELTTLGLSGPVVDDDPISILVDGLTSEVRQLSTDYVKKSQTWSAPEREEHQRRVAAKATELLFKAKPILETRLSNYVALLAFFKGVANQSNAVS